MSSDYLEKLERAAQFSTTTHENAALYRMSTNKDFAVLMDVLTRYVVSQTYSLVSARLEDQNVDLIDQQGAYRLLKKMAKLVDEALPAPSKDL